MTNTIDGLVRAAVATRPDALALADAPNRETFFGDQPRRWTWQELDQAIDRFAGQLADLGVARQTPVAIQLPNVAELAIVILACARLRAIAVPFPIQHRSHELRSGLAVAGAKVMITAPRPDRPDQLESVASVLAEFDAASDDQARPGIVLATCGPTGAAGVVALSLDSPATPPGSDSTSSEPDDIATVCWTSGTTGFPKGVPRTNAMWLASASVQVNELTITAEERILCPFPIVNMAGIGGMLVPWTMAGCALYLHQPLDMAVFMGQIQDERITYTVAPPPLLNGLLRNEAMLDAVDLSSIRAISSGSAPLDPWMVTGWQDRGIEIVNVFGSNEGAALLSTQRVVPDPVERARFFPPPTADGVRVRLVDLESGDDIADVGRPGELRFTGPTVFDGYLESTGEEFDERGYYRTGDVFQWTGTGDPPTLLQFIDRAKDIIIRGGMNISAAEVEALASSHGDVAECAAVAFPDADLGERVGLFVVAAPDASPSLDTIVAHLRAQEIASYKLPERVELIDALPRNPVGKVTKSELRARWG